MTRCMPIKGHVSQPRTTGEVGPSQGWHLCPCQQIPVSLLRLCIRRGSLLSGAVRPVQAQQKGPDVPSYSRLDALTLPPHESPIEHSCTSAYGTAASKCVQMVQNNSSAEARLQGAR